MFIIAFGSAFEMSSQFGDFRVRFGRRELYWSRDTGLVIECLKESSTIFT